MLAVLGGGRGRTALDALELALEDGLGARHAKLLLHVSLEGGPVCVALGDVVVDALGEELALLQGDGLSLRADAGRGEEGGKGGRGHEGG